MVLRKNLKNYKLTCSELFNQLLPAQISEKLDILTSFHDNKNVILILDSLQIRFTPFLIL